MPIVWKDTTSYSQGGSREPRAWSTKLFDLRLTLVRYHRDYPDRWVMLVSPLSIEMGLPGIPLDDLIMAQEVALKTLQQYLLKMAQECGPILPKLLIVDLYGDNESLRVVADTPENEAAVRDYDKADKAYVHEANTEYDPPQFEDFLTERKVSLFETRQISLG